jgi:mannose-6-phosphate isomerase-like protein (cupin superfamily)
MKNHKSVIVQKPWGYEYLAYQNIDVAVWVLHIMKGEQTSLHCHPKKSTGLVVVSGEAEIAFIADSKRIVAPGKQMIRRGLFHQTRAISDVIMLEVESPVDKDDLVRLDDLYGRKQVGYEGAQYELPKNQECVWIEEPIKHKNKNTYQLGTSELCVEKLDLLSDLYTKSDTDILMFLNGGLVKTIDGRKHMVVAPGDVGNANVVKRVAMQMDAFEKNTVVMTIK